MKHIILPLLLTLCLYSTAQAKEWLVDTNLIYEQGTALSHQYIEKNAPEFIKRLDGILPWIVRIEIRHGITQNGYISNHGTGIILANGKILTAKHVLTKNVKNLKAKVKILLTTVDGRVFYASVEKKGKKDWMMLKMKLGKKEQVLLNSPIKVVAPVGGETTVFLGYPARLGLDGQGKVQSFDKGNKKNKIPVSKLQPMMVVGSIMDLKAMDLKILAGFPPVGGMSGGPIFNLKGEVVASQHSVRTTTDDATGRVLRYEIETVPSGDIFPK